ncbi:PREDICTED: ataxin-7-like protein 3 [Priapulus caudatus]|uniref:SAGA-associated factor 11 homolog n=1 Tax=Priapulus caudatus TaxID=37621 RepID=A0ABM1E3Y6_PRICU|nr:PREDICTED: ataxin-7-like protein 3 [Priapulus caudatus]XP_014666907.1 PREDICTED: ataxin-7-like protein 3 [Priapulus caudatus]
MSMYGSSVVEFINSNPGSILFDDSDDQDDDAEEARLSDSPGCGSSPEPDTDMHNAVVQEIYLEILDEVILGLAFEIHRSVKLGTFFLGDSDPQSLKQFEIQEEKGRDVFGKLPMKNKNYDCVCPNCSRNLAASRFAPHLEKCMGMGRNSSRLASKRIANSGKNDSDNDENDNDRDDDWSYRADKKVRNKRKDRSNNSPRRAKASKLGCGELATIVVQSGDLPTPNYEALSWEERKLLLMQTCGVISEHTKKMCTRSHRCPMHTDEQRKSVRLFLLGQLGASQLESEEVHVDIDTYDDGDSQSLRDSLHWEVSASNNPSPADSTSTTNSTNSKKSKKSKGYRKKKNVRPPTPAIETITLN